MLHVTCLDMYNTHMAITIQHVFGLLQVTLMESPAMQAPQLKAIAKDPQIYFLYAFALNRRGEQRRKDGDKEGAKSDQKRVLQMVLDIDGQPEYDIKRYKMLGLAGRIYKQWC